MNQMRDLTVNHTTLNYARTVKHPGAFYDEPGMISLEAITAKDARHCFLDPTTGKTAWETKEQWVQGIIDSYWAIVVTHEFGHTLGLEHNYIGSVDEPNYPHYKDQAKPPRDHIGMYASSVMDYTHDQDRIYWYTGNDANGVPISGWGPYDKAAIAFIYGNTAQNPIPAGSPVPNISGQVSAKAPWNDPLGFTPTGQEVQFLYCNDSQTKYTPLCRQFDTGSTPSEIISNLIDYYETAYKYRNFRQYFTFWNDSAYANGPAGITQEMKKFISQWVFDWGTSELTDTFVRIGITNPTDPERDGGHLLRPADEQVHQRDVGGQLARRGLQLRCHSAVGRAAPFFKTVYDPFFGDVTQQGIILDKFYAMQGWVGLWPSTNYDQNQAGTYIASYGGFGEPFYDDVAQQVVTSMVGGAYDVYPWFVPSAVAMYAQDTHSPSFSGSPNVRDWIGGQRLHAPPGLPRLLPTDRGREQPRAVADDGRDQRDGRQREPQSAGRSAGDHHRSEHAGACGRGRHHRGLRGLRGADDGCGAERDERDRHAHEVSHGAVSDPRPGLHVRRDLHLRPDCGRGRGRTDPGRVHRPG